MAVPQFLYLLKMSSNIGVLSLCGDLLKSFECDILLQEGEDSKTAIIGTGLGNK